MKKLIITKMCLITTFIVAN